MAAQVEVHCAPLLLGLSSLKNLVRFLRFLDDATVEALVNMNETHHQAIMNNKSSLLALRSLSEVKQVVGAVQGMQSLNAREVILNVVYRGADGVVL